MPNDEEVITQETDTETTENTEVEEQEQETESIEDLRKRLATAEAQKEHWREKAKAAKPANVGLSAGDIQAITNAKIRPEDMDRVEWFARANDISLREALEDPEMKAILALREERRATAVATNVENVRRGAVKMTDDTLVQNARFGKLPTSDDQIEQLISAKLKRK